jgi:hypothetical protein
MNTAISPEHTHIHLRRLSIYITLKDLIIIITALCVSYQ